MSVTTYCRRHRKSGRKAGETTARGADHSAKRVTSRSIKHEDLQVDGMRVVSLLRTFSFFLARVVTTYFGGPPGGCLGAARGLGPESCTGRAEAKLGITGTFTTLSFLKISSV